MKLPFVLRSIRNKGVMQGLRYAKEYYALDWKYRTDTRQYDDPPNELGHIHMAVLPSAFKSVFSDLPMKPEQSAFLDLGCGRGAALILAHEAGFTDLHGVEISRKLFGACHENLRRAGITAHLECCNASDYKWPTLDKPVVLFAYNPFHWHVMDAVLHDFRNWRHFHIHHETWFVYFNAQFDQIPDRYFNFYKAYQNDLGAYPFGVKVWHNFIETVLT